jgi:hypothetical protein
MVLGLVSAILALISVLTAVLLAVRKDSKQTGKVEAKIDAFAEKLLKVDADRATMAHYSDDKIAAALALNNTLTAQRDNDILEAVRGFRQVVDDLKAEWAAVRNMWQGERRLIEEITALRVELAKLLTEHHANHASRVNGKVAAPPAEDATSHERVTTSVVREASGRIILHEPDIVRPPTEEVTLPPQGEEDKGK